MALQRRGYDVDGDIPDMPTCRDCATPLDLHNITGLCAECKLVARNKRLGFDDTGQVSRAEAITNVTAILGGRPVVARPADRRKKRS